MKTGDDMRSKEFLKSLETKSQVLSSNPDSVIGEYEAFFAANGIFYSNDVVAFRKNLKGHIELAEQIIIFYEKAKLENERIAILEDLCATGYNKDNLVEMILEVFRTQKESIYLWEYGDLLYSLKHFKYLPQYLEIIENKSLGTARQMVVLLVGKSKKSNVIPVLKDLLNDPDVYGHALDALTNFSGQDIEEIMKSFQTCKIAWIRNTATKYLRKKGLTS